jgi:hypothetical protein
MMRGLGCFILTHSVMAGLVPAISIIEARRHPNWHLGTARKRSALLIEITGTSPVMTNVWGGARHHCHAAAIRLS